MDKYCPRKGTAWKPSRLLMALAGLLLSAGVAAAPADQTTGWTPPVPAFNATYRFKIAGFPFPVEAKRTLQPMGDGVWQMRVQAKNFIGSISETSLFRWDGCTPVTTYYGYRRQGLGQVKSAQVHIDRESRVATSERNDHPPKTFNVPADTTDDIAMALALQCKLARGDKDLTLSVADERGVGEQRFAIDGEQTLTLNDRKIRALRVHRVRDAGSSRQTWLWFEPGRGYTLVELVQKNKDGRHVMTLEDPS